MFCRGAGDQARARRRGDGRSGAGPYLRVRQAIVQGIVGAPKSRHGARTIPLTDDLGRRLSQLRSPNVQPEDLVFRNGNGRPLEPNNLRNRILRSAAIRAGVPGIGLHTLRHTCASLLIERGTAIHELRLGAGVSQDELARRAGMHRTYIGGIERGERNVSFANLLKIADALSERPSRLLSRYERLLAPREGELLA
jgi:integrase